VNNTSGLVNWLNL